MTDSPTNKALRRMRALSEDLITAQEQDGPATAGNKFLAAEVCAKLRPQLESLMGITGFRALLTRALTRAAAEVPLLRTVQMDAEGLLVVADNDMSQAGFAAARAANVALVTHLLTLLTAFIGEHLALQILLGVWPNLRCNNSNTVKGDSE